MLGYTQKEQRCITWRFSPMLRTSRALDCQQAAPSLPLLEQRQHTPEQSTLPAPVHSRRAVRRTNGGRRGGWCAPSSLQSKAAAAGGGCLLCSIGFLTFFPSGKGRVTPGPAWSNCSFWAEPAHLSPPTVPSEPKPRAEFSARKKFLFTFPNNRSSLCYYLKFKNQSSILPPQTRETGHITSLGSFS